MKTLKGFSLLIAVLLCDKVTPLIQVLLLIGLTIFLVLYYGYYIMVPTIEMDKEELEERKKSHMED